MLTSWLVVLLLAGCHAVPPRASAPNREGTADYRRIPEPAGTRHYTLTPGQAWSRPVLVRNPAPLYPAALVELDLPPVDIVARLSVDEQGRVTAAYIPSDDPPSARHHVFAQAVRAAVAEWRFTPMTFTREVRRAHAPATFVRIPKPFSLWFRFRFAVIDGKPTTSSHARRSGSGTP